MKLELYSIYDKQVKAFAPPFFARSRGEAMRQFTEACNGKETMLGKYPLDFELCYCGTFDDQSGVLGPAGPDRVIGAVEVVADVADLVEPGAPRAAGEALNRMRLEREVSRR